MLPIQKLTQQDLFGPFELELNKIWNETFGESQLLRNTKNGNYPKMDIYSTTTGFVIKAAVPGVPKDALSVEVDQGYLRISGKMENVAAGETDTIHWKELCTSRFSRLVKLPDTIDMNKNPSVKLVDGVVTVTFELLQAQKAKSRKLEIE